MRELLLFRHAKSSWDRPDVGDHDRDLTQRGERAAARMGKLLREADILPDHVLCSTAKRARRTWEIARAELPTVPETVLCEALYMAAPQRMLEVIRQHGGDAGRLMLVGHNPGMQELAVRLARRGDAPLRRRLAAKFPTATLARFRLAVDDWTTPVDAAAELLDFWRPVDLEDAGG